MRNQHVQHRLLPPDRWRALAWVVLDGDAEVTGGFARKLAKAVRGARVHLKFLALLSLAALEQDDDTRREARCVVVLCVVLLMVWIRASINELLGVGDVAM